MTTMLIGALAEACGFSRDAIRFYEKEGLISAKRGPQGYRHYSTDSVRRLQLIKKAKDLGFSLAEIRSLVDVWADHILPATEKRRIIQVKLDAVDERIQSLQVLRHELHKSLLEIRDDCQEPG